MEFRGEVPADELTAKMAYTFGSGKVTIKGQLGDAAGKYIVRDASDEFAFTIDSAKESRTIDIEIKSGEPAKGIYKFDGADLVICVDYSLTDRPAKFASKDQPGAALIKL